MVHTSPHDLSAPAQPDPAPAQPDPAPAQPEPAPAQPEPYTFDLDGGRACLDFANTRGSAASAPDHLADYADLVAFAAQSDLITPQDAEWLRAQAAREPAVAAGVLTRAKRLREAMRTIFASLAAGQSLPDAELGVLNFDLAASLSHARVVPTGTKKDGGYRWGWSGRNLDAPLWPITRSAADLLTSDDERGLVRECGADDCAWLFIDTTRNRSRQWCSMQSCGNREKARRHYQRVRDRRATVSAATGG
jgi:predicted RNA-binding Zn ribbon-like protein